MQRWRRANRIFKGCWRQQLGHEGRFIPSDRAMVSIRSLYVGLQRTHEGPAVSFYPVFCLKGRTWRPLESIHRRSAV
jgi:hypothetical protein